MGDKLQNDNVRVSKSELRFGPLSIRREESVPSVDKGRIGDIVIIDDTKGPSSELPIDRIPTNVAIYQKRATNTWEEVLITGTGGQFVEKTGSVMTGDLEFDLTASIGLGTNNAQVSIDASNRVDAVHLPSGTSGERPSAIEGRVRYNETLNLFEGVTDIGWDQFVMNTDNRLRSENMLVVSSSPGEGEFSSIAAAIDSISTNSSSNRFTIHVEPGVYVEPVITMKPYVYLEGTTLESTIVQPNVATNSIFIGAPNAEISKLELNGSTNVANPAVLADSIGPGTLFVTDVSFSNCALPVKVRSNTDISVVSLRRTTLKLNDTMEIGISIESNNGFLAQGVITSFSATGSSATALNDVITVTGPGSTLFSNSYFIVNPSPGVNTANGIRFNDGADVLIGTGTIKQFENNLYSQNVGVAPTIRALASELSDSNTNDVNIEHPGTKGVVGGSMERSSVVADPNSPITFLYSDPVDAATVIAGNLFLGSEHSNINNVTDLIEASPLMGVYFGGGLTSGGTLNLNIGAGVAYLMVSGFPDHTIIRVEWPDTSLTLPDDAASWIFVNNNGTITNSLSKPSDEFNAILGRVVTNTNTIQFIEDVPISGHHPGNKIDRTFREAIGSIYANGSLVSENGSTVRALNVSPGSYFVSQNEFSPNGGTPVEFTENFHSAGAFVINQGATQVNNTQYDDGTNLVSLSAGFFAKHSLYIVGDDINENYLLVFSQAEYPDLITAEASDIPSPPPFFNDGAIALIASIIVQEGQANIQQIIDERPVIGFKASGISASADHGNLLGLIDDDHPQYLLTSGSRSLVGDLNLGTNDIINVGLVDGVIVSAHASRHGPNGNDPLSTAPASTISSNTNNTEGVANSFARSDHTHEVSGFYEILTRTTATSTPFNATGTENYIGVSIAANSVVNLALGNEGQRLIIKDESGNANVNRITVNAQSPDQIDDQENIIIAIDYGSVTLVFLDGQWRII